MKNFFKINRALAAKKKISLLLAALWIVAAGTVKAAEKEIYAVIEDDGTMTLYYDTERVARGGRTDWTDEGYDFYEIVTKAVFDESFKDARPTSTNHWFGGLSYLESIEHLDYLNTEEVTDMAYMFSGTDVKSLDVSHFKTDKVTDMSYMFNYCLSLTSLDLSNFNTENVTNMNSMFLNCGSLASVDVSSFNTEHVADMICMFQNCYALTSLDLNNFNTENVQKTSSMFFNCKALETIICDGDWSQNKSIASSAGMFYNCLKLVGGNGTEYDASHTDVTYAVLDGLDGKNGYFTAPEPPVNQVTISFASSVSDDEVNPDDLPILASIIPLYDEENANNSLQLEKGQLVGTLEQGDALTVLIAGYIYEFDHWSDNTGDAYRDFVVDGNINLTLYLRPRLLTIKTVCDEAQGTVSVTGSPSFRYSDRNAWSATLSAQPKQGYVFAGWVPEMDWNLVDITPELILESYATLIAEGEQYGASPEELAFLGKLFDNPSTLNGSDIDLIPLYFEINENAEIAFRALFKPAGGTGINEVQSNRSGSGADNCTKVLRDDQLYILCGGKTYNAQGQMVK